MSWLHCFWGVGASIGPYVMGYYLTGGYGWNAGYRWYPLFKSPWPLFFLWVSLSGGKMSRVKPIENPHRN